jgi:hypothetical protein
MVFKKGQRAWNKGKKMTTKAKQNLSRIFKSKKKEQTNNWRGGIVKKDGYIFVYSPNHPHKNKANYVYQHRLIMEQYIGRFLKPDELVHHVNGIKDDNRIENLELTTRSYHINVHRTNWRKN